MSGTKSVSHATYVPPSLQPAFMGAFPPTTNGQGSLYANYRMSYFNNYRNETLSRFTMPPTQWGILSSAYSPKPDLVAANRMRDWRSADSPYMGITTVDEARQMEVDDFYKICQMHREQYKDHTGTIHPLSYFKNGEFLYQCPFEPTKDYLKSPLRFNRMIHPPCLPRTFERVGPFPSLPARCLAGTYDQKSCHAFQK